MNAHLLQDSFSGDPLICNPRGQRSPHLPRLPPPNSDLPSGYLIEAAHAPIPQAAATTEANQEKPEAARKGG